MEALTQKIDELNKEANQIEVLKAFEEKTGLKAIYAVLAAAGLIILLVFSGYFAQLLANIVGCAYPLYKSIKSLESPQKDDDKMWLTYWTVFGLFMIFDDCSDFITSYIPYYFLIKMLFLIWLFSPTTRGAVLLYNTVIKDLFSQYSRKLDKLISNLIGESKQLADEIKDKATNPKSLTRLLQVAEKFDDFSKPKNPAAGDTPTADANTADAGAGSPSKADTQPEGNKKDD